MKAVLIPEIPYHKMKSPRNPGIYFFKSQKFAHTLLRGSKFLSKHSDQGANLVISERLKGGQIKGDRILTNQKYSTMKINGRFNTKALVGTPSLIDGIKQGQQKC